MAVMDDTRKGMAHCDDAKMEVDEPTKRNGADVDGKSEGNKENENFKDLMTLNVYHMAQELTARATTNVPWKRGTCTIRFTRGQVSFTFATNNPLSFSLHQERIFAAQKIRIPGKGPQKDIPGKDSYRLDVEFMDDSCALSLSGTQQQIARADELLRYSGVNVLDSQSTFFDMKQTRSTAPAKSTYNTTGAMGNQRKDNQSLSTTAFYGPSDSSTFVPNSSGIGRETQKSTTHQDSDAVKSPLLSLLPNLQSSASSRGRKKAMGFPQPQNKKSTFVNSVSNDFGFNPDKDPYAFEAADDDPGVPVGRGRWNATGIASSASRSRQTGASRARIQTDKPPVERSIDEADRPEEKRMKKDDEKELTTDAGPEKRTKFPRLKKDCVLSNNNSFYSTAPSLSDYLANSMPEERSTAEFYSNRLGLPNGGNACYQNAVISVLGRIQNYAALTHRWRELLCGVKMQERGSDAGKVIENGRKAIRAWDDALLAVRGDRQRFWEKTRAILEESIKTGNYSSEANDVLRRFQEAKNDGSDELLPPNLGEVAVRRLKKCVVDLFGSECQQEDVYDFLARLHSVIDDACIAWRRKFPSRSSPAELPGSVLCVWTTNRYQCEHCGHKSDPTARVQESFILATSIDGTSNDECVTMEWLLDVFFRSAELHCEAPKCKGKPPMKVRKRLTAPLPSHLIILMKRATKDGLKDGRLVTLPEFVEIGRLLAEDVHFEMPDGSAIRERRPPKDVPNHQEPNSDSLGKIKAQTTKTNREVRYRLLGVVEHLGDSTENGHYMATVRFHSPSEKDFRVRDENPVFLQVNDMSVTEMEGMVSSSTSAYMLVYEFVAPDAVDRSGKKDR